MNRWRRFGLAGLLVAATAACDDPVGPAGEIAGEYELAATVQDRVQTPVGPTDQGALLVLHSDRTWVLVRHGAGRTPAPEGFGLTDRYQFDGDAPFVLTMFTEGRYPQVLNMTAVVDGDTLRWGSEIFVRH